MFKVNEYLEIVKEYKEEESFLVETCATYCNDLSDCYVILKKDKLSDLLTFVENNLQNPTYVYTLLNKNTVKGMDLLKSMLKISDYTVEFIKHYDGVQGVLDTFKPNVDTEPEKPAPLAFTTPVVNDSAVTVYDESTPEVLSSTTPDVLDEQDAGWEPKTPVEEEIITEVAEPTEISDSVEIGTVSEEIFEKTEETKTETVVEETYNQVSEQESKMPAIITPEMGELMLMIRAMAAKMGVTDDEQKEVMNEDDILAAKMYLNEMAAVTVRDGMIAVLDSAKTKEELSAVTTFFSMFIKYMKGV